MDTTIASPLAWGQSKRRVQRDSRCNFIGLRRQSGRSIPCRPSHRLLSYPHSGDRQHRKGTTPSSGELQPIFIGSSRPCARRVRPFGCARSARAGIECRKTDCSSSQDTMNGHLGAGPVLRHPDADRVQGKFSRAERHTQSPSSADLPSGFLRRDPHFQGVLK